MNLHPRITDLHNLTYFDVAQATHVLSAIVEQKDLNALKNFINKPSEDYQWKEMVFQWPSLVAPFWREQWCEGWKCVAPIVCQFTHQLSDVFDGVSANTQFSDILINCVFEQIHSKQHKNFDALNAAVGHAIKTNKPDLFDECIKIFTTNEHGFQTLKGFKWSEHTQLSCKIHRVWAMVKILRATQDDNVFFQILATSQESLQLEEIQKLHATLNVFSPQNLHAKDLLIKKLTTVQKLFSLDAWNFCAQIADQPGSSTLNSQHIVNIFAMGLHSKSGVPLCQLTSFVDQYIHTSSGSVLIEKLFHSCTSVSADLLKHISEQHNSVYTEVFSQIVQSSSGVIKGGCNFEYWLHKISSQTDELIALCPKSTPTLDAWKTKLSLQNNIDTTQFQHIRKKM